jgi:segregation and condensation protein A
MHESHDFESSEDAVPVRLENFEGPLDLLLHLIKKHEVSIYDIPITLITTQYLQTLRLMHELDLDVAGDFLVMAATLIHIKSRTLLPRPETAAGVEGDEEDPRDALVRQGGRGAAARTGTSTVGAVAEAGCARGGHCRRRVRAGDRG